MAAIFFRSAVISGVHQGLALGAGLDHGIAVSMTVANTSSIFLAAVKNVCLVAQSAAET